MFLSPPQLRSYFKKNRSRTAPIVIVSGAKGSRGTTFKSNNHKLHLTDEFFVSSDNAVENVR